jgi:hypothetical protein|tara:strand:+ start:291 stop:539 length:249 start_codon:yes stop_codon:yes gene_type:complete
MDWQKQVSTELKMNRKIINLRRERKRRKKTALEEEAQMNRFKFGRIRSEKKKDENNQRKSRQFFSDHKLEKNIPQTKSDQEG